MKFKLTAETLTLTEISANLALDRLKKVNVLMIWYKESDFDPVKLYELILQSYLFCGFPSMIESLKLFRLIFKDFFLPLHRNDSKSIESRGIRNCKLIYKKNYKKLIENMKKLSPELKEWMINEGYGKVMGRKGLTIQEREIINISILTARYFESQLISHIRGCLNTGIKGKDIRIILENLTKIAGKKNVQNALSILDSQTS